MSILETNKIQAFDGDNVTLSATNNIQIQADLYVTGAAQLTGNLTGTNAIFTGTVTAEEFITEKVATSYIYKSGSTKFGDDSQDNHAFTGSLEVLGKHELIGPFTQSGNQLFTGNTNQTGNIDLTGNITQTGNIDLTGGITQTGNTNQTGNIDLTGTLAITGVSNVSSSISTLTTDQRNISASFSTSETLLSSSLVTRLTSASSAASDTRLAISASFSVSETSISSSFASTITGLTSATSASDAVLTTDLLVATASIAVNEGHIENLHAFTGSLNDTYATDAELSAVSGALALSINSYALAADLTVATASIAANQASIGAINAATSSFAFTTGSIFTGKQELTGSIDVSGSISIKPTGDGLTNRLSFDTGEFHAKSPGFYWMTDSITIGSNDESTLFAQLDSTRLQVRTLLSLQPVSTKPSDLTAGTFAVSGSTPIYCDGVDWYPINLGTALP